MTRKLWDRKENCMNVFVCMIKELSEKLQEGRMRNGKKSYLKASYLKNLSSLTLKLGYSYLHIFLKVVRMYNREESSTGNAKKSMKKFRWPWNNVPETFGTHVFYWQETIKFSLNWITHILTDPPIFEALQVVNTEQYARLNGRLTVAWPSECSFQQSVS